MAVEGGDEEEGSAAGLLATCPLEPATCPLAAAAGWTLWMASDVDQLFVWRTNLASDGVNWNKSHWPQIAIKQALYFFGQKYSKAAFDGTFDGFF